MDDLVGGLAGGLGLIIVTFVIVLIVLWTLLPFAVFGTKKLRRENLLAQDAILNELRMMNGKGPIEGAGSPDPQLLGMTPEARKRKLSEERSPAARESVKDGLGRPQ